MARASAGRRAPEPTFDLAVVGHLNVDHLLKVSKLPGVDRTVPVVGRRAELGGTGANIARAAAGCGVRTALVSRVGEDLPSDWLPKLITEKVNIEGVETVPGTSSSACIIVHDATGRQITIIDQGPMGNAGSARLPEELLGRCAWIHLATGDPRYLFRVARWARDHAIRVAVDPAQEVHYRWKPSQLRPYVAMAEILFGNESEIRAAARLLGVPSLRALTQLVPLIVMTRGPRDVLAFSRGGTVRAAARPVPRLGDTTGAGDAFRGGFYGGWFSGQDLKGCLDAGAGCARRWIVSRRKSPR